MEVVLLYSLVPNRRGVGTVGGAGKSPNLVSGGGLENDHECCYRRGNGFLSQIHIKVNIAKFT